MLLVLFLAFVSLGLPDGVLGVAWPSVRRTFELPLSDLGVLLAVATGGYVGSSFASGTLVSRIGIRRLLVWSSAATVASALDYTLAPVWPVMVAGAALAGVGTGAIDAGINAYAADRFSPRTVNWLHACYGLGAMLGPMLMTSVLARGLSWRWGYGLIAIALAGMTVCFHLSGDRWEWRTPADLASSRAAESPAVSLVDTLRRPRVWMHVSLFFVYTGLEVTVGQWTYSLLTDARGVEMAMAGGWISAYWGSLALGRLAVGILASRFAPTTLLRISTGLAPVGALLLWPGYGRFTDLAGLLVLGVSFAPIFPLLISETPGRLGPATASHAIGVQVGAAYLGTASLPGGAGVLARWYGLEALGPVIVTGSVLVLLLHELTVWWPTRVVRRTAATA